MSKRATDRYTTAIDMAEDLRAFLQNAAGTIAPGAAPAVVGPPPGSTQEATAVPTVSPQSDSDQRPIKIVPKGLRSFDEHDADFFLDCCPGPRDRDGLPDSIRFWKTLIEGTDPDKTFRVGLIYGPSGCGKSSLVKAGLLPRLAKHVLHRLYRGDPGRDRKPAAESVAQGLSRPAVGTGAGRLAGSWCGRDECCVPGRSCCLSSTNSSSGSMRSEVRRTPSWSPPCGSATASMLQAIVMVRDDFWMAATRFMDDLEVELVKGQNTAAVDLFDPRHARKVLTAFGTAYGNLPERDGDITKDQHAFLDQAIAEPRPGRQGHLGAACSVRRDGQGQALDPGDLARCRRHRGRRRDVSGRDVQLPAGQSQASSSSESGTGRPQTSAGDRHRHQGADAVGGRNCKTQRATPAAPGTSPTCSTSWTVSLRLITPTDPDRIIGDEQPTDCSRADAITS